VAVAAGEEVAEVEVQARRGPAAPEAEVLEAMVCQGAAAVRGLLRTEAEEEA
jgi:hypothetical protein